MDSLVEKLGMKFPIIQAPMAGVSTPALAAAVSNVGALGSIAVGAVNAVQARAMILTTRDLTIQPFNVNVFCHRSAIPDVDREADWLAYLKPYFDRFGAAAPETLHEIYKSFTDDEPMMDVLLELRPSVVSFHFGLPSQAKIDQLKNAGILLFATATSLDEAEQIMRSGIDAVVAQGWEAGGHRGIFEPSQDDDCMGVSELVSLLVNELDIPVIAAGGIMNGAAIFACLDAGAQAAQLGTAFIDCHESAADAYFRDALRSMAANHTVMTKAISGRLARCLANSFTAIGQLADVPAIPSYPIAYEAGKSLNAAAKNRGDGSFGAQWAGQGAPLARRMSAAQLISVLHDEMNEVVSLR